MQMRFYRHLSARVRGDEISELNFGHYIGQRNSWTRNTKTRTARL